MGSVLKEFTMHWMSMVGILGCLAVATPAHAQSFPSKVITLVVTAAPGGVSDVIARAVGQRLTQAWGQQVVIDNRGGAAHVLGAQTVAKAAPDGHTLLVAEAGTFVINPTLYPKGKLPYDTEKDFTPITGLVRINQALVARLSLPAANVADLIKLAKQKPNELTYGTAGVGSGPQMNIVKFENMAGVVLRPIHYRGAAPALNDVMAGHIDLMSISVSLVAQPYREGKLKVLGVGAKARVSLLPDVPTIAEGGVSDYEAATWFGLAGPKAMPHDLVMKINTEVRQILSDPAFQAKFMAPQRFESMASAPEEFDRYIKQETQRWGKVIREQKLVIQ
jgi:tripartite-type tricarboxylate transporter receptor subunit TctC